MAINLVIFLEKKFKFIENFLSKLQHERVRRSTKLKKIFERKALLESCAANLAYYESKKKELKK
jgi:hypothetical protein